MQNGNTTFRRQPSPPAKHPKHWNASTATQPEHRPHPILDLMTIVCKVVDVDTRQPVPASDLFRARFKTLNIEVDDRTGRVISERGQKRIEHPRNGASFKVWANEDRLMMTGNPTRWLQGHAAFCSLNPVQVASSIFATWRKILSVPEFIITPDHLSTMHLAHMFRFSTPAAARDFLESCKYAMIFGCTERTVEEDGVYFSKASKRRARKLYIDSNKHVNGQRRPDIMGRYIRFEQVLHSEALHELFGSLDPKQLKAFMQTDLRNVIDAELDKLKFLANQDRRVDDFPGTLTYSEEAVLRRWAENTLGRSHSELRYYRKRIHAKTGIDITEPPSPIVLTQLFERRSLRDFFRHACATDLVPEELRLGLA